MTEFKYDFVFLKKHRGESVFVNQTDSLKKFKL